MPAPVGIAAPHTSFAMSAGSRPPSMPESVVSNLSAKLLAGAFNPNIGNLYSPDAFSQAAILKNYQTTANTTIDTEDLLIIFDPHCA